MKTIYSITTVLLTVLLISCNSEENAKLELVGANHSLLQDTVQIGTFTSQKNMYEYGLAMIPKQVTWNSHDSTITYKHKKLDKSMDSSLIKMLNSYHGNDTNNTFILSSPQSLAQSYFIKKKDIETLSKILNNASLIDHVNGVRIYMAAGDENDYSHIYMGPAYVSESSSTNNTPSDTNKNYYIQYDKKEYLYDLTTPCPNACGQGDFGRIVIK